LVGRRVWREVWSEWQGGCGTRSVHRADMVPCVGSTGEVIPRMWRAEAEDTWFASPCELGDRASESTGGCDGREEGGWRLGAEGLRRVCLVKCGYRRLVHVKGE